MPNEPVYATLGRRIWRNVTCSPECSYKARRQRRKKLRREKREARAMRERVTCKHCGQPFVPKRDDARCCSAACKQAAY